MKTKTAKTAKVISISTATDADAEYIKRRIAEADAIDNDCNTKTQEVHSERQRAHALRVKSRSPK